MAPSRGKSLSWFGGICTVFHSRRAILRFHQRRARVQFLQILASTTGFTDWVLGFCWSLLLIGAILTGVTRYVLVL